MAEDEVPQGVIVCVRLRPMFVKRPDGTPGREATCQRVVEMEGQAETGVGCAVTKIYDPADMSAEPRKYAFDRSWWSCDGSTEDPERPGFRIPDGPNSKYVDQDMVWQDIGQIVMKNALKGYNCTVFAYGQSGCGKSYSVVGDSPNWGIIPRTVKALFDVVDGNKDEDVRFHVEIAMVEVYMDEVYDLLEPRKKDRQKLNVFNNKGEVFIYDPKDRKNMDKIWRACSNHDKAESFRKMGDANRSIRATGMNPESSRGHTLFILRFRKEVKRGGWVEEFRSKLCLVDLAGSERAHDTGLTGVGLEEGIAINQSLSALGQCLVQLCKGERVNYSDKLTKLLAESLGGNAVTVMIAALSPADINYNDTLSTLRFADNAKKMPVKVKKQLDPTAELIRQLQEENAKLQAQLQSMGSEEIEKERKEWESKLAAADKKVSESQKALEDMKANAESSSRVHLTRAKTGVEQEELTVEDLETKVKELEDMKNNSDAKLEELNLEISKLQARIQDIQEKDGPEEAQQEQDELVDLMRNKTTTITQNNSIQEQQKETLAMLMEARLGEIERLQDARDAVRLEILKVKKGGGEDTTAQDEALAKLEESLVLARQDCEKMSEKAVEVGMGKIFNAAILALQRQDEDSKVQYLQDQLSILQASADQDHAEVKRLEEESAKALEEADKAAQAAREAAEHALQEKMEQVQAIAAERDEARTEASRLREEGGTYKQDLQEKQEAIAAIIRSEMQSWEDKLKKADESEHVLKKSFENMGVSMQDMMAMITQGTGFGGKEASICHFVNLCEDAHDDGLIYMIPPGTTKIKKYEDDDEEVCIKLDGESIKAVHAILESLDSGVTIHAAVEGAVLWVNGNALKGTEKVKLEHGARVILGHDFVFRFVDPKAQKKRKAANPAATTGGFDEKTGAPVVIDWQYAMAELSKKNGVDVDEEIRKAREKLNDEMAQREAKLAEEQKLLEDKMLQEREDYEQQIETLKKKGQRSSVQDKEQEQIKAQSILRGFKGKLETQRARAQWVRAAFTAGKDERFELDIRISRQQMADVQPRMVEANRIAANFGIKYSFHFVDAIDPRSRRATTFDDGGDEAAVAPKRLLLQMKVDHEVKGKAQLWSIQKFQDRFVKMLAFSNRSSEQKTTDEDLDIFWDDFEHQLVGAAAIGVTPLLKLDLVREYITLRDLSGNVTGAVEVSMRMALTSKPSMMRISTAAGSAVLKDQEVVGSLSFGRLSYENPSSQNWGSFFVRFSWYDTEGRMEHMSPASQAQDLQHTFGFSQVCTPDFLKFLEEGVMAVQVRAYDKGVAAGELDIVKQKLKLTEAELDRIKKEQDEERSAYQKELDEAHERVEQAKEEAKFEANKALEAQQAAQAAQAQAAAQAEAAAPGEAPAPAPAPAPVAPAVADDGPWQDMRYATLEEVKAELVRARGQVFKITHDKDDLKARLNKLQGDTTGRAVAPDAEFRHTDMESAHQHILYLETKVRAMEELEKRNDTLQRQVRELQKQKDSEGGCEIS